MKSAIEQSVKEKLKSLAKEQRTTFAELWKNLILERFLARLASSPYRKKFVLKGGTLLAKYIPLGRETQDLDFLIQKLSNTEESLRAVLEAICDINIDDTFAFEVTKIKILEHAQLPYTGSEITLTAKFGATKTVIRIDLGFGDRVYPIEHLIHLTTTSQGPLFESRISLHCYPKEFIFAEKLETVVYRGGGNTRMKDFHDLYSLIFLNALDAHLCEKAIQLVFKHRKTPLRKIPLIFEKDSLELLETNWKAYCKKIKTNTFQLPESLQKVIATVNRWLEKNTSL